MNFHIYHPGDALRPFVKQYYFWEDNTRGLIQLPQQLFALGDQYMVFIQQGEASVKPAQHAAFTLPQQAVIGHLTCACHLQVKGPVKMVIVQLNAYGCYRLLGMNVQSFTNYYRNLATQDNSAWNALAVQLAQAGQSDIPGILNHAYEQALSAGNPALKQVDKMVDMLLSRQGNINMEELSKAFRMSKPTVERIFTTVVGLPPQLFARMARFRAALRALQQVNTPRWEITRTPYYNQAMFIHDYLEFNGETPSWFAHAGHGSIAHMPAATAVPVAVAS
ncbi:helix-turn-helix domain-containing protein [Chitinophaga solisilvae]|uniref:helix-turn-helix domain-containing protein n=1 Tax=Chitinophaga solisilvae TaxID=1233460 RepID=UPI00136CC057|nr:helix-turn-helix domain-containing protein [Chitinophaga solisilvae]